MADKSWASYVGRDRSFLEQLRSKCERFGCELKDRGCFASYVEHLEGTLAPAKSGDPAAKLDWVHNHFAPIVLDVDFRDEAASEFVRTVKRLHAGIPIIVVGANVSLARFCTVRLDGAEAIFFKPLQEWSGLIESVETSLARISRWRETSNRLAEMEGIAYRSAPTISMRGEHHPPLVAISHHA